MSRLSAEHRALAEELAGSYHCGNDAAFDDIVDEYGEAVALRVHAEAKRIAGEADVCEAFRQITM
jgi:hypothetical protein